jgi:hypothetical protein
MSHLENLQCETESLAQFGAKVAARICASKQKFTIERVVLRESLATDSLDFDRFRPLMSLARGILCKIFLHCIRVSNDRVKHKMHHTIERSFFAPDAYCDLSPLQ